MHKKWIVRQDVVILAGILISLSTADHRVCYLQSKCGECRQSYRRVNARGGSQYCGMIMSSRSVMIII